MRKCLFHLHLDVHRTPQCASQPSNSGPTRPDNVRRSGMRWNQRPTTGESVFLRQVRAPEACHTRSTAPAADDRRIPCGGGQTPQSLAYRIPLEGGEKTVDLLELASLRLVRVDLVSTACE